MRAHASPLPRVTVARVCKTAAVKSVFLFLSFGFTHNMTPCNSSASPTRSRAWMASCLSTILEQLRSLLIESHIVVFARQKLFQDLEVACRHAMRMQKQQAQELSVNATRSEHGKREEILMMMFY